MSNVLVFDLDDTLYPEHEYVLSGFLSVSEWVQDNYGIVGFYKIAKDLFYQGCNRKLFDLTLANLGIKATSELIMELVNTYRKHVPKISLFDDAVWILDYYKHTSQYAIITDGYYDSQRAKVEALNITDIFQHIVYTDSYGRDYWKPCISCFEYVMDFFGHNQKYIYIGDNCDKDFMAPNLLGWCSIQVLRPNGVYRSVTDDITKKPKYIINSLYELPPIIGSL